MARDVLPHLGPVRRRNRGRLESGDGTVVDCQIEELAHKFPQGCSSKSIELFLSPPSN